MDWARDKISNNSRKPILADKVELLKLEDGADFKLVRMIGPSKRVAHHMLPVFKQDGSPVMNKFKQQTRIPKVCLAYNPKTGKFPDDAAKKCPYCKIDPDTPRIEVHSNVIDRELQSDFNAKKRNKQRSKKETKKREFFNGSSWYVAEGKASKNLTPVRFFRITPSIGSKISDYTSLNKVKNKKTGEVKVYSPDHAKFGFDLNVKFDNSKKNPSEKYSVVKDERTELTEEELNYLLWDIDVDAPEKYEEAEKEAKSFKKRMDAGEMVESKSSKRKNKDDDDDYDDDEDMEDEDNDDNEDEDDDDDNVKSKNKKNKDKKQKKDKKKSKKDDEDDDDDEDWDNDDDDDSDNDDDDDDDEDDDDDNDDDDDDDDVKSKNKKKNKKNKKNKKGKKDKKKSKKDEDDDDEDDDEDNSDDDEDDWDDD